MKNVYDEKAVQNHDGTANLVRLIENLRGDQVIQTMNYAWVDVGKQLKEHKHDDCVEYYFFLNGNGEMTIGEKKFFVAKGNFVVVEMGQLHTLRNNGKEKLDFVTLRALVK